MKKLPAADSAIVKHLVKTSAYFFAPAVLGLAFWLVTSATGVAGPNLCDVCHKHTLTLTLACNSLEYRRHIDHGDTMGPCSATTISGKNTGLKAKPDGG